MMNGAAKSCPIDGQNQSVTEKCGTKRPVDFVEASQSCPSSACVHFVAFRDERYWSAVKVWGRPDFIHMGGDRRSQREIGSDDIVVFATGDESQPFERNYPDIIELKLHGSPGEASNSTLPSLKLRAFLALNPSLKTTGFSGEGFQS